jgi:H/ACA ribonucleoprotein complex subunit 4
MTFLPSDLIILDQDEFDQAKQSNKGVNPFDRPIIEYLKFGIINLDKHAGPSSHEIVSIIKTILNIDKAGHSGTLDPNVTGVLPVALLSATRVLSTLLKAPKEYICNMQVKDPMSKDTWENYFSEFTGTIYQVPPLKSNVVKKLRKRRIYSLNLMEIQNHEVLFSVQCEAGTYIRTLCEDLGRAAGTRSFMKELRRTKTGPFEEKDVVTLHQIFDAMEDYKDGFGEENLRKVVRPVEEAVKHVPVIIPRENAINPICHGTDLAIPGILAYTNFIPGQIIAIMSPKGELIGLGSSLASSNSIDEQHKGKIVHPGKVIMSRGTY